ncbi:unnamed protein product [Brachionus calyciflorus]|uniref:TATA box-binding protein-associated factor RNA polymerase I subunit B n=1 Tax=Brachionus calyciflorus TaxID=104777 RepID=A0A813P0Z4_9BILA|nr:unnamed protein product [Brachionus calyciflorus]
MPKLICSICESDSFENIDGFYYCNVCGNKSQNVCDIELSDEELAVGANDLTSSPIKSTKIRQKDENRELENMVEKNYSTFEVYNYMLKRQCDDLIRLGVDPMIKEVVLKLWIKYMKKLKVAFLENETENIDTRNIKWTRDKKFFEIYHLDLNHAKEEKAIKENLMNEKNEFNFGIYSNYKTTIDDEEENKMIVDYNPSNENIDENESNNDSDQESIKNEENFLEEELNNSFDLAPENQKNILLIKFEWVRMPHTIALLNLGLLMIKSQFLITDLIRFIYNGKVSYFNVDEVLPHHMEFNYQEDSTMFNLLSVPQADYLRYLTSKLGQFLEIDEIELIKLSKITDRFVLDLNLPNELISIVYLLMEKEKPIEILNIQKAEYENLEACALSYIFVSIVVLFVYDNYDDVSLLFEKNKERVFCLEEWIKTMQNKLKNVKTEYFGCDLEDVMTIEDLKSLKVLNLKHRHKLRTKAYLAQYRKDDILTTLRAPLENEIDSIENDMSNLEINENLFFISKLDHQGLGDFSSKSIEPYFNTEKLNIIGQECFKSMNFKTFLKDLIEPADLRGKYLLGLQTSTLDWLLEIFSDISLTRDFLKMFDHVKKLLNKIK